LLGFLNILWEALPYFHPEKGRERVGCILSLLFIFDMGGVVTINTNVIPSIVEYLGITEKRFFQLAGENWTKLLTGKIDAQQFWLQISNQINRKIKENLFATYFHPRRNFEVIEIINDLKKKYRIVCGTNTFQIHYQYHLEQGDYHFFDKVYASHLMGIAKPDKLFYQYILKHENVTKERTVFIDDTMENVISACNIGIQSIHFRDSDLLKNNLKNFLIY